VLRIYAETLDRLRVRLNMYLVSNKVNRSKVCYRLKRTVSAMLQYANKIDKKVVDGRQ